jgi:hypothetical protein
MSSDWLAAPASAVMDCFLARAVMGWRLRPGTLPALRGRLVYLTQSRRGEAGRRVNGYERPVPPFSSSWRFLGELLNAVDPRFQVVLYHRAPIDWCCTVYDESTAATSPVASADAADAPLACCRVLLVAYGVPFRETFDREDWGMPTAEERREAARLRAAAQPGGAFRSARKRR